MRALGSDMFARRERSLWRDQQGSALIEGAAVIPLLIALVFGVFELILLVSRIANSVGELLPT